MFDDNLGLEILKEVAKISNSVANLENTLNQIIEVIRSKMHVDAIAIFLLDEESQQLRLKASSGARTNRADLVRLKVGQGLTGWAAEKKMSLAISDTLHDPRSFHFKEIEEEKFRSMLSVPMIVNNTCIGVINAGMEETRVFSENEISLLETISSQVSGCIRNALLYDQSQKLVKELTILYDVSLAVQTTINVEQGLWIILSGLTRGEAGGFNRVILFAVNEKTNELEGMMGLGPDSAEDAHRIWASLSKMEGSLQQWIVSETEKDGYQRSAFNTFARSLRFPIKSGESLLAEAVLQKKPLNVTNARNDPRVMRKDLIDVLGTNAFAIAPLVAYERSLGAILVDNRYNNKPIIDANMELLTRFATHASWVLENSRLFSQLSETNRELLSTKEQLGHSEKLAAMGELSAEVAHEIKNPLVSIGGFARRLQDKIAKLQVEEQYQQDCKSALKYSEIIVTEVERLESLLKDILLLSKPGDLNLREYPVDALLKEIIDLFQAKLLEKNIKVQTTLDTNIGSIAMDDQKMKQVLINLLYNSIESMPNGGKILIVTYLEMATKDSPMVTIRIEDAGGGIPLEVFFNVFHPFFTTKHGGTGLGLPICKKIVENHGGNIRMENHIGKGLIVYIQLPLHNVCTYNSKTESAG